MAPNPSLDVTPIIQPKKIDTSKTKKEDQLYPAELRHPRTEEFHPSPLDEPAMNIQPEKVNTFKPREEDQLDPAELHRRRTKEIQLSPADRPAVVVTIVPKDIQSDLAKLPPDATQETFKELVENYNEPEDLKLIVDRAANTLPTLDYIQTLKRIIVRHKAIDQDELLDELVKAYSQVPTSLYRLESLLETAARLNDRRSQYQERLDPQIIEVAAELVATALDSGDVNQAEKVIALIKHPLHEVREIGASRIFPRFSREAQELVHFQTLRAKACLQATSQVQTLEATKFLLRTALAQAQSMNKRYVNINLFGEIKATALQTGVFEDVSFAEQFIEEYAKLPNGQPMQIIPEIAESIVSPDDRLRILTKWLTSDWFTLNSEVFHLIVTVYSDIPATIEKLRKLVDTVTDIQDRYPQHTAQLSAEATDLGGVLIIESIERDLADEGYQTFALLCRIDNRISTAINVTPRAEDQSITPLFLIDVVRIATLFRERPDLQNRLVSAAKSSASRNNLFHNVDFTADFIDRCMEMPGVEVSQEIEVILKEIETPSERLMILSVIIPRVDRRLAVDLAKKSLATLSALSPLDDSMRQHLRSLPSCCNSHQLLEDRELCRDLTLTLVDNGEFRDARETLSRHAAMSKEVALKTSTKYPGFALYALRSALESECDFAYSDQHAEVLENITQVIAQYSPQVAQRVWQQSLELARKVAPDVSTNRQRVSFYKSYSLQPKPPDPKNPGSGGNGSGSVAVRMVLDAEFENFIENKEDLFIVALADMLRLAPEDIFILDRSAGSAVYELALPLETNCYLLKHKFETQDQDFIEFQLVIKVPVESVDLISIAPEQAVVVQEAITATRTGITEIEVETRNGSARVCVRSSDGKKVSTDRPLPYDDSQLITILKVLEEGTLEKRDHWKPEQIEYLYQIGFLEAKPMSAGDAWTKVKLYFPKGVDVKRIREFLQEYRASTVFRTVLCQLMNIQRAWQPTEIRILWELYLLATVNLVSDCAERIGDRIFADLLASEKDVYHILQSSIDESKSKEMAWQLEVKQKDTNLARYPWELMRHKQQHLLLDDSLKLDLARSVEHCQPARPLGISPPLNILYIESRPYVQENWLPQTQHRTIEEVLEDSIEKSGEISLDVLSTSRHKSSPEAPPTFEDIIDQIKIKQYHVIHFDGHGTFGRQCPRCRITYHPHYETCTKCFARLNDPQGLLQIENLHKQQDWVDTKDLRNLLGQASLRLVVLSACSSAKVYGETVFSGIAPALLEDGVPSVVGMQFSIYEDHANKFMETFYRTLARSGNVRKAMHAGRHKLSRDRSWYVPVLYLRSLDVTGQLFTPHNR